MRANGGVKCAGRDSLVLRDEVVSQLVKQGDASDDRRAGDEMIAIGQQLIEERRIFRVSSNEAVTRMIGVAALQRTVLREIVESDDFIIRAQQFLDEITGDEASCSSDENLHWRRAPLPKKFQMSITRRPPRFSSR